MINRDLLQNDLKEAIRNSDTVRKNTLRMALAAIKLAEVEKRGSLNEPDILAILQKETKGRKETIEDAKKANRDDLIKSAEAELAILQTYLPQPLLPEELDELVQASIEETRATHPGDMGKVMKALMPKVQGRADGKVVSRRVRELLA
jgi:uncharacterized protein YqeY